MEDSQKQIDEYQLEYLDDDVRAVWNFLNPEHNETITISKDKLRDIAEHFIINHMQTLGRDAIKCTVEQCEVEGIKLDSVEICPDGITLDENKFVPGEKVKVIIIKEK